MRPHQQDQDETRPSEHQTTCHKMEPAQTGPGPGRPEQRRDSCGRSSGFQTGEHSGRTMQIFHSLSVQTAAPAAPGRGSHTKPAFTSRSPTLRTERGHGDARQRLVIPWVNSKMESWNMSCLLQLGDGFPSSRVLSLRPKSPGDLWWLRIKRRSASDMVHLLEKWKMGTKRRQ